MYKNQLQELAQRSCFNLPSYSCIREGPDHAPRFKATVNFNGENFESPTFCTTLRQAEHAAAEVALDVLSKKGPSKALAARVLDETGVYKNLLQETAHRAGLKLPVYTTIRSGPGHVPVFSCKVELVGMSFTGEPAKTKKQAQKNAALTAWSALKKLSKSVVSSSSFSFSPLSESGGNDEQEQALISRYLATLKPPEANKSPQRERQLRRGYAPFRNDLIPYGSGRSFYSLQHQNWPCSRFSPELSLYQTCHQETASQGQEHLLALSSIPTSPPRPQNFPFIQSIFQPDHGHYFLAQGHEPVSLAPELSPFLYFPNSVSVMPVPVRSLSQVTIQEIAENLQMEKERFKGDGDSDCWKNNFPSNVPMLSPIEIPNSAVSLNSHSQQKMQEILQEKKDDEKRATSPGFMDAGFSPTTLNTDGTKCRVQNPHGLDYLRSNIRPQSPPMVNSSGSVRGFVPASFAAPVTIRTSGAVPTASLKPESSNPRIHAPPPTRIAASLCSPRPRREGMKNLGSMPSVNFMAPAVHIRSVVPVCSAPPTKKFPGAASGSQEGLSTRTEEPRRDVSAASSDFGKLRI